MRRTEPNAFSLLEVVVAVGLFAIGMVASLALFAPVATTIARTGEAEAAARVADSVVARLRGLPFATVDAVFVQEPAAVQLLDASGSYNPNDGTHPAVIFARIDGEAGIYDAVRRDWIDSRGNRLDNADKFFEIDLVRHNAFSPKSGVDPATVLAFTVRVRWPAFLPAGGGNAQQIGAGGIGRVTFDRSRQQVLLVNASLAR